MCGIAGIWRFGGEREETLMAEGKRMTDALSHRGPDDEGLWVDGSRGVFLGQRRLSIVDLSPAGHQPMASACGRYVITYNGEVYNSAELRQELTHRNIAWRGHSDTESMIEAISAWGVEAAVKKFIGMFAFALWDRAEGCMYLGRDRFGIKPLYWTVQQGFLLFGSELKALIASRTLSVRIDARALASYMRFAYVPAPATIYERVHKLEPARILAIRGPGETATTQYWDLRAIAARGLSSPRQELDDTTAVASLDTLLRDAVRRRMIADVPLGAFLSGGIDSSTVVAMMQAQSDKPIQTFTIGFDEAEYDESDHAKAVAAHLGTDHTELRLSPAEAQAVIPDLPTMYDEPFADSSQIPTFLVSRLARSKVIVSLSGDGGDELFAGYGRYQWAESVVGSLAAVPGMVSRLLGCTAGAVSSSAWDRALRLAGIRNGGARVRNMLDHLEMRDPEQVIRSAMSTWRRPEEVVPAATEYRTLLWDRSMTNGFPQLTERMQVADSLTYLPDDILTKVDRASMAVGLEARVPLIDHRVAEFAFSLPARFRVRDGESKWILRQVLYKYLPRALIDRPKMGFGVPIGEWLRGPLRDWSETMLAERTLEEDGLLAAAPIRAAWQQHLAGTYDWTPRLWTVLMYQSWRQRWVGV